MKVCFNYQRTIDGQLFKEGVQDMDDSFNSHWYFLGLVAAKDVTVLVPAQAQNQASSVSQTVKEDDMATELADLAQLEENLIDQISDAKAKIKKKKGGRK